MTEFCCECQEDIDDSRIVDSPFGETICEMCAVKCFICENHFRYKDILIVNGDNICPECRDCLFIIYDSYRKTYLANYCEELKIWHSDKSLIKLFDSRIEAQEIIDLFLSGNKRYEIQKL